jgi:hypothetical protein
MEQDEMYIYQKISNLYTKSVLFGGVNTTPSPKTANDSSGAKVGDSATKTQHPWHHSTDTKHYFLYVESEVRFVIAFMRKSMSDKKRHFSWRMAHPFSKSGV